MYIYIYIHAQTSLHAWWRRRDEFEIRNWVGSNGEERRQERWVADDGDKRFGAAAAPRQKARVDYYGHGGQIKVKL